ncbi:hypothetical protein GN156_33315, partial [bacterium LRH843]|nr:hypothetical protein [bacterium LRH843]
DFAKLQVQGQRLIRVTATHAGLGGDDVISTGSGHDTVLGGDGQDQITATAGNNVLAGDHAEFVYHANGVLNTVTSTFISEGDSDT